jgi:hypothetical protein
MIQGLYNPSIHGIKVCKGLKKNPKFFLHQSLSKSKDDFKEKLLKRKCFYSQPIFKLVEYHLLSFAH